MSKMVDRTLHNGIIRHINYYQSLDLIAVAEMGSIAVKFYSSNCEVKQVLAPPFGSTTFVLAYAFSEKENKFVIAASDKHLYVFEKEGHSFRYVRAIETEANNLSLWYFD